MHGYGSLTRDSLSWRVWCRREVEGGDTYLSIYLLLVRQSQVISIIISFFSFLFRLRHTYRERFTSNIYAPVQESCVNHQNNLLRTSIFPHQLFTAISRKEKNEDTYNYTHTIERQMYPYDWTEYEIAALMQSSPQNQPFVSEQSGQSSEKSAYAHTITRVSDQSVDQVFIYLIYAYNRQIIARSNPKCQTLWQYSLSPPRVLPTSTFFESHQCSNNTSLVVLLRVGHTCNGGVQTIQNAPVCSRPLSV